LPRRFTPRNDKPAPAQLKTVIASGAKQSLLYSGAAPKPRLPRLARAELRVEHYLMGRESANWDINERIRNMTRCDFNEEEISMMKGILETYLHDLTAEISSTEKMSFREDLKKQKHFILDMLGRIDKKAA
jgi:hypothetical protein